MGGYILREEEKNIVLPPDAVERLITAGNGDAALLFLELQRQYRRQQKYLNL